MIQALILLASLLLIVGCPGKSKDGEPARVNRKRVYVKGDPRQLIAGAELNSRSPFDESTINQLHDYKVASYFEFMEQAELEPIAEAQSAEELQRQNQTADQSEVQGQNAAISVAQTKGEWQMKIFDGSTVFNFERANDGSLNIHGYQQDGQTHSAEILHWSISPDKQWMSFLMFSKFNGGGKYLGAFYLQRRRNQHAGVPDSGANFVFVFGPRKKLRWDQSRLLRIDLCGAPQYAPLAATAVKEWGNALKGRLKVELNVVEKFAPFSDVNQHCIYVTRSYLSEPNRKEANMGSTTSIFDTYTASLIDSDFFFFESEFAKLREGRTSAPEKTRGAAFTFVHEVGHMVGMGHPPEGTMSVMSYGRDSTSLYQYDIEGVQELYPLVH